MFYHKTEDGYILDHEIRYWSKRYKKLIIVEEGYFSDGATGAIDIFSEAWWVHDKICDTGTWTNGEKITNWQASTVLGDILLSEWRPFRAVYWWFATFISGGGKARKNGMFFLKKGEI